MSHRTSRLFFCLLAVVLISLPRSSAGAPVRTVATTKVTTRPLIQRKIDDRKLVVLKGHISPQARPQFDQGPVADNLPMDHMVMVLRRSPEQEQALATLIDQLHDPKSPMFHKWLTPDEFGGVFGPADQDIATLTSWLRANNFKVEEVSPSRTTLVFSGTAGDVHQAFHAEIHQFNVRGEKHIANVKEPSIPIALAPVVAGFRALHDFQAKPLSHTVGAFKRDAGSTAWRPVSAPGATPSLTSLSGPYGNAYLVGPQDFYTIYNVNPLLNAGITGAGQTIAVVEQSDVNPADVTAFRSQFGLPAYPSTPNATQGGVNYFNGISTGGYCADPGIAADEDEAILDVEWAGAVAPHATVNVISCASSTTTQGTDLALLYAVNHLSSTVSAISYSYGACEAAMAPSTNAFYNATYQQAVAQGQTVVVATGDGGAPGCDNTAGAVPNPATRGNAVNGLASTPYNIAAGGTDFNDQYQGLVNTYWSNSTAAPYGTARSYIPETAWNGSCASPLLRSYAANLGLNPGATPEAWCNNAAFKAQYGDFVFLDGAGGGVSGIYSKPTWQSAYGVPNDAKRDLPDVSLFASNLVYGHALAVCQSSKGYACNPADSTATQAMAAGGTSFVAPQIAGLIALVNQKTQSRQGQANYTLYSLATAEYGSASTPNQANLSACDGSLQGDAAAPTCVFYDVNASPNPKGGTVVDNISQPCTPGTPNCTRTVPSDTYGLLTTSTGAPAYSVGKGYDLATGLGSINFANLVNGWSSSGGGSGSATTTTLIASPAIILQPDSTTLTATVTNSSVTPPAGSVSFFLGNASGRLLGTAVLVPASTSSSTATLVLPGTALSTGPNQIVASFPGDGAGDSASVSSQATVTVGLVQLVKQPAPPISLAASAPSVSFFSGAGWIASQSTLITATLAGSPAPTGSVQILLGATVLGTAALSGGSASLTVDSSLLALGANNLTALYLGDGNYLASAGPSVPVTVTVTNTPVSFGNVNVNAVSPVQQLTVTFTASTRVSNVSILTSGALGLDYADSGSTCTTATYHSGDACLLRAALTPQVPGKRLGAFSLFDPSGAPILSIPAIGVGQGPQFSFGSAQAASKTANLNGPASVAVDGLGNLFIADGLNNRVVEIPAGGGAAQTISSASDHLALPQGIAVDGAGNVYVTDDTRVLEYPYYNGKYGASIAITQNGDVALPSGIGVDPAGNLFVADSFHNRVVKYSNVNGAFDRAHPTIYGTGDLTWPEDVAVDTQGNLFVADTGYAPPGTTPTSFGRIVEYIGGGSSFTTVNVTGLDAPSGLAVDAAGNLFISDGNNGRIVEVTPGAGQQTVLTTGGVSGGIAIDLKGNLWVPEFFSNQVLALAPSVPNLNFGTQFYNFFIGGTQNWGPLTATLMNTGNQAGLVTAVNLPANFAQQGGGCYTGSSVNPASNCTLSVIFTTTGILQGAPFNQNASVANPVNAANFTVFGWAPL